MTSLFSLVILTILGITINSDTSDGHRILGIFPLHGTSHAILGKQLMKILAKHGHKVDVISHFPLKEPITNYTDLSLQGSLEIITNNVSFSKVETLSDFSIKEIMDLTAYPVCELLKHSVLQSIIQNPPTNPPYDLVIVEVFFL